MTVKESFNISGAPTTWGDPENKNNIIATTVYGNKFCSVLKQNNIYGIQFHPEKSQKAGMILIKNFLNQ